MKKIKVLIIDDSALVRDILTKGLSQDPTLEIVGASPDAFTGRDKIIETRPDVLTLDIEMPRMDGLEFLKRLLPQYPIPVVIVSSLTQKGKEITIQALEAGAVDFVSKPTSDIVQGLSGMLMELRTKIKIAASANVSHWKDKKEPNFNNHLRGRALSESTDKVIAIGASTGGTEALRTIIPGLPIDIPGIVIVQHMPPGFTKMFADRLNSLSLLQIKEAESGDRIRMGRVLIAPGDHHVKVVRSGGYYQVVCQKGEKVNGHCPSVDVLMNSVAQSVGKNAYGIMLTGMGSDGAKGMLAMKQAGAYNIAQDEASSIVYGMPKCANDLGGADAVVSLEKIFSHLIERMN